MTQRSMVYIGGSINPGHLYSVNFFAWLTGETLLLHLVRGFSIIHNELTRKRLTKQYVSAHRPFPLSTNCMNCPSFFSFRDKNRFIKVILNILSPLMYSYRQDFAIQSQT